MKNIISVDEAGLILVWTYAKETFYQKFQAFSPIAKLMQSNLN